MPNRMQRFNGLESLLIKEEQFLNDKRFFLLRLIGENLD